MARPKKTQPEVKYTEFFTTPGVIIDDGAGIRMENGAIYKRTIVPSKYRPDKPTDPEIEEFNNNLDEDGLKIYEAED